MTTVSHEGLEVTVKTPAPHRTGSDDMTSLRRKLDHMANLYSQAVFSGNSQAAESFNMNIEQLDVYSPKSIQDAAFIQYRIREMTASTPFDMEAVQFLEQVYKDGGVANKFYIHQPN